MVKHPTNRLERLQVNAKKDRRRKREKEDELPPRETLADNAEDT